MGMSASQARLLSLQARQSNLEYQGQQINQARTVLSQQATALYNSLLSMTVPTPPSTTDFQTIEYSGVMGANEFKLGTIIPEAGGDTYNVEIKYTKTGTAIKGGSYMSVSTYDEPQYLEGKKISEGNGYTAPTEVTYISKGGKRELGKEDVTAEEGQTPAYGADTPVMHLVTGTQSNYSGKYYYTDKNGNYVAANSYDEAINNPNNKGTQVYIATTVGDLGADYDWSKGKDYVYDPDNTGTYYTGGLQCNSGDIYYTADGSVVTMEQVGTNIDGQPVYGFPDGITEVYLKGAGKDQFQNPNYLSSEAAKGTTVGGNETYPLAQEYLGSSYEGALQAIANTYPEYKNEDGTPNESKIQADFEVFFQTNEAGTKVPYFVNKTELAQFETVSDSTGQMQVEVFSMMSNGSYTDAVETPGCKLTFDSSGRISSISIPVTDSEGNTIYNTVPLEATSVTDDAAYKDAYADYEYETYLYDQKNKEINAKTEIIQQEDRNLELKLQRLDNERTQITTEIEAVEKVINDNIESSYKSFSG